MSAGKIAKRKDALAIEISDESLKIAMFKQAADAGKIAFIEHFDINGKNAEEVAEILKNALASIPRKNLDILIVVPTKFAIAKTLQIPSIDENEIRDILNLQAGRHTPYSRDEIVVDYINLGRFQEVYSKVYVVMVNREIIKNRLLIAEVAGLKIDRVIFAADGIGKLFASTLKSESEEIVEVLLNFDANNSDFNVYNTKGLLFARSIPVGVKELQQDKEKALGRLYDELKKSFEAYQAEDIATAPKLIKINGSNIVLNDLEKTLSEKFEIEVKRISLNDCAEIEESYQNLIGPSNAISFLASIAVLLTSESLKMDLIPEELRLRKKFEAKGKKIIISGVLAMVIFCQICLVFLLKIHYKENELDQIKALFKATIEEAKDLRVLSQRASIIRPYLKDKKDAVEVIAKFYDLLPDEIYLKNMSMDEKGAILIKGTSQSMSRIFAFVTELEKDDFFQNVKTEFTESRKENDQEVAEFGISMNIEGKIVIEEPEESDAESDKEGGGTQEATEEE